MTIFYILGNKLRDIPLPRYEESAAIITRITIN